MKDFSLPATSWNELKIIISSYANQKKEVSNEDIVKTSGLSNDKISRNNKFLSDNGLIEGGRNKKPTVLCEKLGRAIMHEQISDIKKYTRQIVENNENIAELVTSLRIQGDKTKDEFASHVLYCSGQSDTQYTRAGSKCIVDILLESDFVFEDNEVLKITQSDNNQAEDNLDINEEETILNKFNDDKAIPQNINPQLRSSSISYDNRPTIAINLNLQLPESDKSEVYENLFKSLRKNLIDGQL